MMTCNYCGCKELDIIARYIRLERKNVLQCKNCGLVYLEIKKDKKEIESFYSSSEYRKDATMSVQSAEEHFYDKITQHDTKNRIQFISNNIDIRDKKILEIGSASGSLLEKLLEYDAKEAMGIELDKGTCGFNKIQLETVERYNSIVQLRNILCNQNSEKNIEKILQT